MEGGDTEKLHKNELVCMSKEGWWARLGQEFLQAVLLMFVFERRPIFEMWYFLKNDHETILKCKWVSASAVNFAADSRRSTIAGSGAKPLKNFDFLTSGGKINA